MENVPLLALRAASFVFQLGMAAINAAINALGAKPEGEPLPTVTHGAGNLAVFEHFLPLIRSKSAVVIGRYPGLEEFAAAHGLRLTVLERQPGPSDLPDTACEYLLPEAEWVFITASSIPNKTFPRLAELSRDATSVLMGPTAPWLPKLYHFGIDFLAGADIVDFDAARAVVAEGGGVRLFGESVRYRVLPLTPQAAKDWSRALIAETVREKNALLKEMAGWHGQGRRARYPGHARLEGANRRLSRLDTCFKTLWDRCPDPSPEPRCH
jgi:uncharacterized protein (DUF4213/DUF364 family)